MRPAEPAAVEVGIDGDHDRSRRVGGVVVGVHLRPAERRERRRRCSWRQEALGVEPGLGLRVPAMSSRVQPLARGGWRTRGCSPRATRPRRGRRRRRAARARRPATVGLGSTGSGRRICSSSRSCAEAVLGGDRALGRAGIGWPTSGPRHRRATRSCRESPRPRAKGPLAGRAPRARRRPSRSTCRCLAPRAPSRGGCRRRLGARRPTRRRHRHAARCRSTSRSRGYGVDTLVRGWARPRTPKGRALETERRLAEEYPGRGVCARLREPLRAPGGHDPLRADAPMSG